MASKAEPPRNQALFDYCASTFLDQWPQALTEVSVPTLWLHPSRDEISLLQNGPLWRGEAWALGDGVAAPLLEKLQRAIDAFGGDAFVRTQVRSPKDSQLFMRCRGRVSSAWLALQMLRESARFHQDCAWLQRHGVLPALAIRRWLDLEPWAEFRCFLRGRQTVGITQLRRQERVPEPMRSDPRHLQAFLRSFCSEIGPRLPRDNVVADVVVPRWDADAGRGPQALLLELNPWHGLTDPGWFDWRRPGSFDGTIRLT